MVKFVRREMPAEALTEKSSHSEKLEGVLSYFRMRVHVASFLSFFLFKENDFEFDVQAFTYLVTKTFVNSFHDGDLKSKPDMIAALYKVNEVFQYLDGAHVVATREDKFVFLDDLFYLTSKEYLESFLGKDNLTDSLGYIKGLYRELLPTSKEMEKRND